MLPYEGHCSTKVLMKRSMPRRKEDLEFSRAGSINFTGSPATSSNTKTKAAHLKPLNKSTWHGGFIIICAESVKQLAPARRALRVGQCGRRRPRSCPRRYSRPWGIKWLHELHLYDILR